MDDPNPAVVFWGDEHVMIYNEPYTSIIRTQHERGAMGRPALTAMPEFRDQLVPMLEHNRTKGEAVTHKNMALFLEKQGLLEETYMSLRYVPLIDEDGIVVGSYESVSDVTREIISDRRLATLLQIGDHTSKAHVLEDFWVEATNALSYNDKDFPFAMLYSVEGRNSRSSSQSSSAGGSTFSRLKMLRCTLRGAIGVPAGHPAAPVLDDIAASDDGFMPFLRQALKTKKMLVLSVGDKDLPTSLLEDIQFRGYQEMPKFVVVLPLVPTTTDNVSGIIVLGINPRRSLDQDYKQFINFCGNVLTTSLASVMLLEDEVRRSTALSRQARLIQTRLGEELIFSQAETQKSEERFQKFADRADVAMFVLDTAGEYSYRNDRWFDIFATAAGATSVQEAWKAVADEQEIAHASEYWQKLMTSHKNITFEMRLSIPYQPPHGLVVEQRDAQRHHRWILCSCFPELDKDGHIVEVFGVVTDISKQKWGETVQQMRADDALESKRQLENFVDSVSHEMRNPLSAIIQSADGLIASHHGLLDENAEQLLSVSLEWLMGGIGKLN